MNREEALNLLKYNHYKKKLGKIPFIIPGEAQKFKKILMEFEIARKGKTRLSPIIKLFVDQGGKTIYWDKLKDFSKRPRDQ